MAWDTARSMEGEGNRMKNISRRSFLGLTGAVALSMAGGSMLSGCSGNANPTSSAANSSASTAAEAFMTEGKGQHIIIGRRGKLFKIAPTVIAENMGYFEEEGCDVEFQQVELAEGFAALSTGNLDVMLVGTVQPLEYIAKGTPMYIFGGTVLNGTEMLAGPDFGTKLESADSFKGLTIAYHRPETGQVAFRSWLKDQGLDIDGGDVAFIPLDTEQAQIEAILKGEVDMSLTNNAFGYINRDRGIQVVGLVKDFTGDYPCCRQNASEKAYKEKFLSLVDFEIALLRGYKVFKEQPDVAIPMLVEYSEQSADYIDAALYGTDDYEAAMQLLPDPCRDATLGFYESLKDVNQLSESAPSADDYVVTSVYRSALDTLMDREPDEQFWKDLDAIYKKQNV